MKSKKCRWRIGYWLLITAHNFIWCQERHYQMCFLLHGNHYLKGMQYIFWSSADDLTLNQQSATITTARWKLLHEFTLVIHRANREIIFQEMATSCPLVFFDFTFFYFCSWLYILSSLEIYCKFAGTCWKPSFFSNFWLLAFVIKYELLSTQKAKKYLSTFI